jgi:hypothetical protein
MYYGPSNVAVVKVALLGNKEACRQLLDEVKNLKIAEEKGLAGTVVPRCLDQGLDAEVSHLFHHIDIYRCDLSIP